MYFKIYLRKDACPKGTNRYNCSLFKEFADDPDIKIVANARTPSGRPARKISGETKDESIFYKILGCCMKCHKEYENQGR